LNKNKEWKSLFGSIKNSLLALSGVHSKFLILPEDTIIKYSYFIPYNIPREFNKNKKFSYPFLQKDKYKIRAVYSPSFDLGVEKIVSNEITIKVIPHKKQDEEAFKWLAQFDNPHFIYESINRRGYYVYDDSNLVLKNQAFIQKFPHSTLSEWAKLNLIIFHSLNKKHEAVSSDIKIGKALFRELEASCKNKLILKKLNELKDYTLYRQITTSQLNVQKLKLKLEIENECFPYLEPLYYSISLTNESENDVEIFNPFNRFVQPKIEIKVKNKDYWFLLKDSNRNQFCCGIPAYETHFFKLRPFVLTKKKAISKSYSWASFNYYNEIKEYIGQNKRIQFKTFSKTSERDSIFSNIIELPVKKYRGQDKKAEKWLQELETPDFFYEFFVCKIRGGRRHKMTDQEVKEKSIEFIEKFPKSIFIPWIKLSLAYWYKYGFFDYGHDRGSKRQPDEKEALKILEELNSVPDIEFQKERKLLWDSLQPEDNLDWLFEDEN
jgi:hypothetical protein